jgi:hypothetical protein
MAECPAREVSIPDRKARLPLSQPPTTRSLRQLFETGSLQ